VSALHAANLANPWILARILLSLCAVTLALIASFGAARILSIPAETPPDERALEAERDLELATTGLRFAFALAIVSAAATVLVAHRLAGSVRGAMCAYGVLESGRWGPRALTASALASLAAAGWLGVRAVDARLSRGSLGRALSRGALAVTILLAMDALVSGRFLLGVDLRAHASCCTTRLAFETTRAPASLGGDPGTSAAIATGAIVVTLASIAALRARPSPKRAVVACGLAALASVAVLWAGRDVVAPFVFESPSHRCLYCLLRASEGGIWGPLFALGWTAASLLIPWVLAAGWAGRRSAAAAASASSIRAMTIPWMLAWALTWIAAAAPAIAFRWSSGTWSLFG
jgi:hypothetical protein